MGHIPEDKNSEDFMNASAEEWSKPSEPEPQPEINAEPADRWGSPAPQNAASSDENRWGSEPIEKAQRDVKPKKARQDTSKEKKGKFKWWIIVIIIVVVLCLCACVTIVVLLITGVISWDMITGFDLAPLRLISLV